MPFSGVERNRIGAASTAQTVLVGCFFVYVIAAEGWIFCFDMLVASFYELAGPATQSLMTRQVSSAEQGFVPGG